MVIHGNRREVAVAAFADATRGVWVTPLLSSRSIHSITHTSRYVRSLQLMKLQSLLPSISRLE